MPPSCAINDSFRVKYFQQYLTEVGRAEANGVPIEAYFAWSLLDNFEWADGKVFCIISGYEKRFGIVYVDFNDRNRTRHVKNSARFLSDYFKK